MSLQDGPISIKAEEDVIMASVNGSMLLNFLFGKSFLSDTGYPAATN